MSNHLKMTFNNLSPQQLKNWNLLLTKKYVFFFFKIVSFLIITVVTGRIVKIYRKLQMRKLL